MLFEFPLSPETKLEERCLKRQNIASYISQEIPILEDTYKSKIMFFLLDEKQ